MKNISSICVRADGPISLDFAGQTDGTECAIVHVVDSKRTWDTVAFFIPNSETNALKAAIEAFNSAYKREKELDQLEAAE